MQAAQGPLAPYIDPESNLLVAPLEPDNALLLIERMPCLVHLLPSFRAAAINKFAQGKESGVFLSGSSPSSAGSGATRNGVLLYSIEKGRRGVVKLACRVLCLEGASIAAGRALLIPTAIMHQASRIEATINKKDEGQRAFWQGLGFELHDDIAEIEVELGMSRFQPAPATAAPTGHEAPSQPQPGKAKKQRRQASDADAAGSPQRPRHAPPPSRAMGHEARAPPPLPVANQLEPSLIPGDDVMGGVPPDVLPVVPGDHGGGGLLDVGRLEEAEEAAEAPADIYIRKSCPGASEAHLLCVPQGMEPPMPEAWHLVPETELELGHTVQCQQCRRVFLVARDQAETVESLNSSLLGHAE